MIICDKLPVYCPRFYRNLNVFYRYSSELPDFIILICDSSSDSSLCSNCQRICTEKLREAHRSHIPVQVPVLTNLEMLPTLD